ncbi:DUF6960 family protein [Pseudomonas peli]|uniref:DUF6960 family protein n=1 Tax=Pseudomonas peli TaxID=592361 RepID=UPI003D31B59F
MEWAIFTWFPEHGAEKIHGDDIDLLANGVQGRIVKVLGKDENWVIINFHTDAIRVEESSLIETPEPKFKLGDFVKTTPPRTEKNGVVSLVSWHYTKKKPYYLLTTNSIESHSRYLEHELAQA